MSREELFEMAVDLTGSRLGPLFGSVRVTVDGASHSADELREMCAEHYAIPIGQVGEPVPAESGLTDSGPEAHT